VVNGQVSVIQNGALLQITNSPNSIINWQSFSIGASEITRFIQQSQASAVLNRVTGSAGAIDPSVILGALQSNGRVFLVNPSGILFGAGAQVDVAGLVATSLNLSNSDFLAGKLKFTDGAGAGSVVNQGNIATGAGGEVYLIGNAVRNDGIIKSPNGDVMLAAGNSVELVNPGTPNLRVEITAPDNAARNLGQIVVDSGRAGIYAGLINNSGTIRADSVVTEGGKILLKATKSTTLESSSVLSAQGKGGGEIKVLADESVKVAGTLDASAPTGGDGGFIETSAHSVKVADGTVVAGSAPFGKSGMWLIDPNDFTIGATGCLVAPTCDIEGATLATNLGTLPVTITSDQGTISGFGDIFVNDAVSWNSSNSLTLLARRNVNVNAPMTNTGTGGLSMYAGWNGNVPTPGVNAGTGVIDIIDGGLSFASGTVTLIAGLNIQQEIVGPITAASLLADAPFGYVNLDNAVNFVGTLAGRARSLFLFKNGQLLTIGSVGGIDGITVTGGSSAEAHVTVTSGDLVVNKDVKATAAGSSNAAIITLRSTNGAITVGSATVEARGGSGESGGAASVTLTAGTTITLNSGAAVNAIGGDGSCCSFGGTANVTLIAPSGITVNSGASILAQGGNFTSSNGNAGAAFVNICAGTFGSGCSSATGAAIINGSVTATGGTAASNSIGGFASATVDGTSISMNGGSVTATGGSGGFNGGAAMVTLNAATSINLSGGALVKAEGGRGNGGTFQVGTTDATVSLTAGTTIDVNGSTVQALGGDMSGTGAAGNAAVVLIAPGGITVQNSSRVEAIGGDGRPDGGSANGGNAIVNLCAGALVSGNCTPSSTGFITVADSLISAIGGRGGDSSNGLRGGDATVSLTGSTINLNSGAVISAVGGQGGFGAVSFGSSSFGGTGGRGGNAIVALTGTTINVNAGSSIMASGGYGGNGISFGGDGGNASVNLSGATITVNSPITATGGFGGSGSSSNGRRGDAFIGIRAPGVISITGDGELDTLAATGRQAIIKIAGTDGGEPVSVAPPNPAASISLTSAIVRANAEDAEGHIQLLASGNITLGGAFGSIVAQNTTSGDALVSLASASSIVLGGTGGVETFGSGGGGISLNAGDKIVGGGPGSTFLFVSGGTKTVSLTAVNGIGTPALPVMFFNSLSSITAQNSGTGDIALGFASVCCGTLNINTNDLSGIFNANPNGTYFIGADGGEGISLNAAFMPNGANPGPGQTVYLRSGSPSSSFPLAISGAGSIAGAGNVILVADYMDIQGTVTAGNNIYVTPFTPGRAIDLGGLSSPGSALALDALELSRLTALGLGIGTNGTTANTGAITFTAPVGPFNAFPNLFGSTITQSASGTALNSPGGLNAFATGNILLTDAGNNFGSFGGTSGGLLSLVTTGNIGLGALTATGTASVTSGGAIFNLGSTGAGTITAPSVQLAAANGIGQSVAPIFLPTATSVTASNSASGDIVLSRPAGNFTIGTGGWTLSNAGGDYIIGGNTVTLNSGAPSSGDMFVGANDIIVGPTGYTNSGIASLSAVNNINVNGNLTGNDLALFGGNQVNINGAIANGTNSASVLATTLNITGGSTPARLKAGTALGVVAGEINVTGGSGTNALAEMSVGPAGTMDVFTVASPVTSGNVNLRGGPGSGAYARIFGDPDVGSLLVPVSVDGVINMTAGTGSGAYARIESASPSSIYVDFTTVTSGGYFVNGVEGTVASNGSGFFAGGQPAILDQNLTVTYGGSSFVSGILPPAVQQAIDLLAAVTNQQTTLTQTTNTSGEGGSGTGDPKDEKQKKQLPICGK
jgi:filamentous hemagglutinin family protein